MQEDVKFKQSPEGVGSEVVQTDVVSEKMHEDVVSENLQKHTVSGQAVCEKRKVSQSLPTQNDLML